MFILIFVSGDYRRTLTREVEAVDIDGAAGMGIALVDSGVEFGAGSSWFLAGVIQTTTLSEVGAVIEGLL